MSFSAAASPHAVLFLGTVRQQKVERVVTSTLNRVCRHAVLNARGSRSTTQTPPCVGQNAFVLGPADGKIANGEMAPDGCEGELELAPALARLMATPYLMTFGSWQGRFRDFMTLPCHKLKKC